MKYIQVFPIRSAPRTFHGPKTLYFSSSGSLVLHSPEFPLDNAMMEK